MKLSDSKFELPKRIMASVKVSDPIIAHPIVLCAAKYEIAKSPGIRIQAISLLK
jgi:hypothetical protein